MAKTTDKKQVSRVKIKKKAWFRIVAPQLFGQQEIGETYVETSESVVGRKVEVNLRELTNNIKDQSAYVVFRIAKAEGTLLRTVPIGYFLTPSHIKRLVRKNATRLDDFFLLTTKAGEKIVVKTIMITRSKVQRSVQKALRSMFKSLLQEELRKIDFGGFLSLLMGGKVRKALFALNKITPLREAAIRVLEIQETNEQLSGELKMGEQKVEIRTPEVSQSETESGEEVEERKETEEEPESSVKELQ